MTKKCFILLAILVITFASANSQDEDDFIVEVLRPQGFRIYTENLPGLQRVGFRGNINEKLLRRGTAQYTADFLLDDHDFWVYENPSALLNPGDTLYYRVQFLSRTSGVLDFAREYHVAEDYNFDE